MSESLKHLTLLLMSCLLAIILGGYARAESYCEQQWYRGCVDINTQGIAVCQGMFQDDYAYRSRCIDKSNQTYEKCTAQAKFIHYNVRTHQCSF